MADSANFQETQQFALSHIGHTVNYEYRSLRARDDEPYLKNTGILIQNKDQSTSVLSRSLTKNGQICEETFAFPSPLFAYRELRAIDELTGMQAFHQASPTAPKRTSDEQRDDLRGNQGAMLGNQGAMLGNQGAMLTNQAEMMARLDLLVQRGVSPAPQDPALAQTLAAMQQQLAALATAQQQQQQQQQNSQQLFATTLANLQQQQQQQLQNSQQQFATAIANLQQQQRPALAPPTVAPVPTIATPAPGSIDVGTALLELADALRPKPDDDDDDGDTHFRPHLLRTWGEFIAEQGLPIWELAVRGAFSAPAAKADLELLITYTSSYFGSAQPEWPPQGAAKRMFSELLRRVRIAASGVNPHKVAAQMVKVDHRGDPLGAALASASKTDGPGKRTNARPVCYYCGQKGHTATKCFKRIAANAEIPTKPLSTPAAASSSPAPTRRRQGGDQGSN